MGEKPKFDLSNVGGKPKDWLDRAREPSVLGAREYALLGGTAILVLITLGALAWGAIRIVFH